MTRRTARIINYTVAIAALLAVLGLAGAIEGGF